MGVDILDFRCTHAKEKFVDMKLTSVQTRGILNVTATITDIFLRRT